ncbi:MAG: glycosyltransferase family 4 protein [bacterium]
MEKDKSSKIKVLHLYSSFTSGGAEKRVISLAENLGKIGVYNLIGCPKGSYLEKEAIKLGLAVCPIIIHNSLDFIGILNLAKIVKMERIDILHIHQGKIFWPSIFVKWLFFNKLKLVFHRRADKKSSLLSRRHYKFADKIICVSKRVAENLIKFDKVEPLKISVIYTGMEIDEDLYNGCKIRKEYNIEDKIVVGIVAGINKPEGKGQRYLLQAALFLKERYQNLHYLIVGDGSLKPELERYAYDMKIDDIVTFAGYRENVYDFIKAMDIVVLASCGTEALPGVLIEAHLLGKPVIGTDTGGISETFIDGKTGFLIPSRDIESLKRRLIELIEDESLRRKMGEAGKEFAKERFGVKNSCSEVKALYEALVNDKN